MANIALLNRCNLKCPYCFASSYTGKETEDIDIPTFEELLNFTYPENKIGIIGGEPFLHKEINSLLNIAHQKPWIDVITIFTNGIFLDKALNSLYMSRLELLVNVNSKRDIGVSSFERLEANLEKAIAIMGKDRVHLGINVYEDGQDFSDFLYLVKKHGYRKIRVSVVIPHDKSEGGIAYFNRMKPTLLSLYKKLKELSVCPCYDCNAIPSCIYTREELDFLRSLPFSNDYERMIFTGEKSVCSPVIDLYPDKSATRCFGMYDSLRVKIDGFESISDLYNHFFKEIDCRLVNTPSRVECTQCYKYKTFNCYGGCLCYK